MAKLYINEGGKEAVYEPFDDSPEVTVGRGASNAVQIADGHASKVHFVLRRIRGRWKVVDLESKNGTKVNGAFVNTRWLGDGDTLSVGNVVIRFDAEGEPAGAPPRAAVPVAAAPVRTAVASAPAAPPRAAPAAPARPAAPSARPAPAPQRPAAPAPRAAPAPVAAAPSPVSQRSAPRRRRDEDYDEEDGEERPRFERKKSGLSGGVIGLLIVAGVGVLVLIVSMIMTGENPNSVARDKAENLRQAQRYEEALQVYEREAIPGESGWEAIEKSMEDLRGLIAEKTKDVRTREATAWHKQHLFLIATGPSWRPKEAPSEREAAQRLREFLRLYGDTYLAKVIVNAKDDTNRAYQTILRENQDPDRTRAKAWGEVENSIAPYVNAGKLGPAHDLIAFAIQVERLNLPAAEYTTFENQARDRQKQLHDEAVSQLLKAINDGKVLAGSGQAAVGKEKVKATLRIIAWPDGELKRMADEATRNW